MSAESEYICDVCGFEWSAIPPTECPRCSALLKKFQPVPLERLFQRDRRVRKIGGSFQHTGTVVATFKTRAGAERIVLEFDAPVDGMLHIYRPDQVEDL